jgi:hypothetical protein
MVIPVFGTQLPSSGIFRFEPSLQGLFACHERQSPSASYPLSLESHTFSLDQPSIMHHLSGEFWLGDGPALGNSFYDDNPLNGTQT